jgi:DNA processing protein
VTGVGSAERLARAALTRVAEPGDVTLTGLVSRHGAEAVVAGLRDGNTFGLEQARVWRLRLDGYDPASDLEVAGGCGARLVCPGDEEWPACLDDLAGVLGLSRRGASAAYGSGAGGDPIRNGGVPLALWARGRGHLSDLCARSVALVGSRAATAYGTEVAGDIAYSVASRGISIVSGAAYGVDGAAHRGALGAGAPTVAVLACGVDVSYPRGHATLLQRVVDDGLVLSEVPPGTSPSRIRFLVRNRLIAALGCGTVVVEAALRSGALNTARWAEQLLRPVMGVPGPVTSAMSAGVHQLIRDGIACLVTDGDEVLETVSEMGEHLAPVRAGETRPRDHLDELTMRVLEAVPAVRAVGTDRIARTAGLPVHEVQVKLGRLLLQDFVEQCGQQWRLSGSARSG